MLCCGTHAFSRWQDDRFKYSDLVLGDPKIRAYAGAPLMYQRDGKTFKLGTLCVIDATPRDVSSEELSLLETMAKLVIAEIEIREKNLKPALNRSVKVHLFPRRKAGDQVFPEKGRLPVKVDRETIESMYGLPQVGHAVFPTALLPSSDHNHAPHRTLSQARNTHL